MHGPVGEHTVVTVNSAYDDTERDREWDAVNAMAAAASFVKEQQRQAREWKVVTLTFVFLLSGEQSNGTMAEERTDSGLYRVPTTLRISAAENVDEALKRAAKGVMDKKASAAAQNNAFMVSRCGAWPMLT